MTSPRTGRSTGVSRLPNRRESDLCLETELRLGAELVCLHSAKQFAGADGERCLGKVFWVEPGSEHRDGWMFVILTGGYAQCRRCGRTMTQDNCATWDEAWATAGNLAPPRHTHHRG